MGNPKHAVLLVTYSDRLDDPARDLAESIWRSLSGDRYTSSIHSETASIGPATPGSDRSVGKTEWWVDRDTGQSSEQFWITEFSLPHASSLKATKLISWTLRGAIRPISYFIQRFKARSKDSTRRGVTLGWIWDALWVASIIIAMPFVLLALVLRFVAAVNAVVLVGLWGILFWIIFGEQGVSSLVSDIGGFTSRVLDGASVPALDFDTLFAVFAGGIVAILVSLVLGARSLLRWLLRRVLSESPADRRLRDWVAYVAMPTYAGQLKHQLERRISSLDGDPDVGDVIVVSEGVPVFLAYEVLSRCSDLHKPTFLLTMRAWLPQIRRLSDLWFWCDSSEWWRFEQGAPPNVQWHHFYSKWGRNRQPTVLLQHPSGRVLATIHAHYTFFRGWGSRTVANVLLSLTRQ